MLLFSCSVVSNSLQPHELQHTRLPCPSLSPGVCSHSCPLDWWCHPAISCSLTAFSSCLQSFPAAGSFPLSQLFASGGQSIGSFSFSIFLPMNIQDWLPLGLTGLISLQSKESSPTQQLKRINSLDSIFFILQLSCPYDYWKNHSFD